jgi:hypothetical protein
MSERLSSSQSASAPPRFVTSALQVSAGMGDRLKRSVKFEDNLILRNPPEFISYYTLSPLTLQNYTQGVRNSPCLRLWDNSLTHQNVSNNESKKREIAAATTPSHSRATYSIYFFLYTEQNTLPSSSSTITVSDNKALQNSKIQKSRQHHICSEQKQKVRVEEAALQNEKELYGWFLPVFSGRKFYQLRWLTWTKFFSSCSCCIGTFLGQRIRRSSNRRQCTKRHSQRSSFLVVGGAREHSKRSGNNARRLTKTGFWLILTGEFQVTIHVSIQISSVWDELLGCHRHVERQVCNLGR